MLNLSKFKQNLHYRKKYKIKYRVDNRLDYDLDYRVENWQDQSIG